MRRELDRERREKVRRWLFSSLPTRLLDASLRQGEEGLSGRSEGDLPNPHPTSKGEHVQLSRVLP